MAAEPARSAGPADSYIGSLISLTSKYEIRYEGVLYNINTEESSIGLRNVRSFGTEGRKKDGPQVPPSEKVYEYILFRGSDIKDLQVKSSPPVQAPQPIHHDPAIIQSHYPQPAAASTTFPSAVSGTTNLSSHTSQIGLSGDSTFQGAMPLHQPGGSLGSWGPPSLPPSVNGNGLAMPPMYWQGFYAPQSGHPHLQQQSLLRPSPGMSMAPSGQQPLQYPGINSSLPAGSLTMPTPNFPTSTLPEVDSYLLQPGSSHSPNLFSTSVPSTLPSTVSPAEYASLVSEKSANALPNKIPTGFPTTMGASVPSVTSLTTPILDVNAIAPPTSDKTKGVSGLSLLDQTSSPLLDINSTVSLTSDKAKTVPTSNNAETSAPSLVTPSQLLQPGPRTVSSLVSSELGHKEVEVVQASSSSEKPRASEDTQPPILPLPSRPEQKVNSAPHYHNYHNQNYRGRGRGRRNGILGAPTKFTEDFDFTAMNEKFNKDEVWGDLGKSEKAQLNDNGGDENDDEYSAESSEHDSKPVYVKDDFFDSISSNALDNERRNGRGRFSEQMKLDTETFGNFPRQNHYYHHRGGRGSGRGGRSWGSYNGRGYGYGGRGRGQNMPNRDN